MKTWSFYHAETGEFAPEVVQCLPERLQSMIPQGYRAIEGLFDHLSQRVDLATKNVVDWRPPQPSEDHEWMPERKRWHLKSAVAEKRARADQAQSRIHKLEASQHRALREAALGDPDAVQRLKNIDDEIAALRGDLKGG